MIAVCLHFLASVVLWHCDVHRACFHARRRPARAGYKPPQPNTCEQCHATHTQHTHTNKNSLGVTFFFYLLVSVLGYLSLGDYVPDNVLLVSRV